MGCLIKGEWHDIGYDTSETHGEFVREESGFRQWIKAEGSTPFAPEPQRYQLVVSLACPWAHRTLIVRALKKLDSVIDVVVVNPLMLAHGWEFEAGTARGCDPIHDKKYLYELYLLAHPHYSGRVTVPLLWDRKLNTIVNNESSEIIRMFDQAFTAFSDDTMTLYPEAWRSDIDAINAFVYDRINNGVYQCGFATTQVAYEQACHALFDALDTLEKRLQGCDFLVHNTLTEADCRLFPTLIRFDSVYVGHFKCNLKRIADYPNLSRYLSHLYHYPGIQDTVNMSHIKQHYYMSHPTINPSGIVPLGPESAFGR